MLRVPTSMGDLHGALLRARLPVLWSIVAVAAAAIVWHVEDPFLKRI